MTDLSNVSRPSVLWKSLADERKIQAADAFWKDKNAFSEQAEVIAAIAQRIKFRPKSVMALPREKKSRYLVNLGAMTELVAARLLVAFHLEQRRPLMGAFLDALGVKHEDGLISEEEMSAPAEDRLRGAVEAISKAFPSDDVSVYLSTLVWQDPDTWGALAEMPQTQAAPAASPRG